MCFDISRFWYISIISNGKDCNIATCLARFTVPLEDGTSSRQHAHPSFIHAQLVDLNMFDKSQIERLQAATIRILHAMIALGVLELLYQAMFNSCQSIFCRTM